MAHFFKNAAVEDYRVKSERMVIPFSITFHATPASKVHATDLPDALVLSTEGKTSDASSADSGCNFTTEADANGIFGILVKNLGTVKKLLYADVTNLSSGTAVVSRKGASSTGVTASNNIAVSVDWNGDLSMTSLSGNLMLDFIISKA